VGSLPRDDGMLIVDSHEDLAWNALTFGREYMRSAAETRSLEAGSETPARNGNTLLGMAARRATRIRPFNMTVTNVPGPQFPMYMLGSKLLVQYPAVPLWAGHGVGIALFSYNGEMAWGLNADWDVVPDVAAFSTAV